MNEESCQTELPTTVQKPLSSPEDSEEQDATPVAVKRGRSPDISEVWL